MPSPVSRTVTTTSPSSRWQCTSMRPPLGVNLIALASRLETDWCRRCRSPRTAPQSSTSLATCERPSRAPAAASGRCTPSTTAARSTRSRSSCSLPATMRETSRRSLTSCACWRTPRSIACSARWRCAASMRAVAQHRQPADDALQRRAQLVREHGEELVLGLVGALGVARAPPPRAAARRVRPPSRLRSLTSRKTSTTPMISPSASRIGAPLSSIGISVAVARQQHGVVGEPDDRALAQHLASTGLSTVARRLLVDDAKDLVERPAARLALRPAGQRLGDRVHEHDPPAARRWRSPRRRCCAA